MKTFLQTFKGSYIQTFDDTKQNKPLVRCMSLKDACKNWQELIDLNKQGAGIYFTPNPCSGGRKEENVTAINWVYVDMDEGTKGEMMDRIEKSPISPSIITESSRGYHLYWRCDCSRPQFDKIIRGLIDFYAGDPAITSTNEVLRLLNFYHMKDMKNPFKIQIKHFEIKTLLPENMIKAFPYIPPMKKLQTKHNLNDNDLRVIKDIPIKNVLSRLGVEINSGNFIVEGGETTSASVNVKDNYINRFSGKVGSGSNIDVVMAYGKMELKEAIEWLEDMAGIKRGFDATKCIGTHEIEDEIDMITTLPYTWGTDKADSIISPIQRNHLCLFGGEQGTGKTAYTFFIAKKNAELGHRVLYISLEMSGENIITRIARDYSGITKAQWRNKSTISDTQRLAYKRKKQEILSIKNLVLAGITQGEKTNKENITKIIQHVKPDLVFIDNFDLVEDKPGLNTLQKEEVVSKHFMDFTNNFKVPVILLHHYKKGKEKDGSQRGLNAFRGSAKITHNSDTVIVGRRHNKENATEEEMAMYTLLQVKDREFGIGGMCTTYFYKGEFYDKYIY